MPAYSDEFSLSFKGSPTILQVIPALDSGGAEIGTLQIAEAIINSGGRAIIAARKGQLSKGLLDKKIELIELPLDTKNPIQIVKNIGLIKNLILKEKVDIIHVRSRAPAWSAYKAAKLTKIPFMTTYHGAYRSRTPFKTFYNSIMARGERVITISQYITDHIIKKYKNYPWFDPSKIRLIHRGVDFQYYDPSLVSQEKVEDLRQEWNISPTTRILLLPGRISRKKGQDVLIKALFLMKNADVSIVFIGSANGHESYLNFLLKSASTYDLEGRVKWFPPSSDLRTAYQLADVVLCPSVAPEGFGRLMVEAQAMEKPLVASEHGAAREVIQENITGWITPPGDALNLAQTLDRVLDLSPEKLSEVGRKGRTYVKTHFSNNAMCSKTIQVYQELLRKKRALTNR